MKRILSLILVVVMLCSTFAGLQITAQAANDLPESGSCGENVNYTFNSATGELFISGSGQITNFTGYGSFFSPFYNQTGITKVIIQSGVTGIGNDAFRFCSEVVSISIGDSVKRIGDNAFYGCSKLTSVSVPNSVISIGSDAFRFCSGLISVAIPSSVTSIGSSAFDDTAYYNNAFNWDNDVLYIDHALIKVKTTISGNCQIKKGTTCIAGNALCGCSGLTSITIPDSVNSIGGYAFYDCNGLKSVTMGNSVKSIGSYAFFDCDSLTSITIPDSVTGIGESAFRACSALSSITIGNSVTFIGNYAFLGCKRIKELKMPCSLSIYNSYGESNFNNFTNIEKLILTKGTGTMQNYDMSYQYTPWYLSRESLKEIVLEEGIEHIGDYALYAQNNITRILIPTSVTSIGEHAFGAWSALEDVFYTKSEAQWNQMLIAADNDALLRATIHFNHVHQFETDKLYCLNGCGKSNPDYIPPHVHIYSVSITKPALDQYGFTTHICSCGDMYIDAYTAPTGKVTGFKFAARTQAAEKLTWTVMKGITGYQVQISNAAGNAWATAKATTANTILFNGLTAGSGYKFRIRTFIKCPDGKHYFGPWSATLTSPTLPTGTTVKAAAGVKFFTASWGRKAVTGYQIQYATNAKFTGAKTITIKNAKTYKYVVKNLKAKTNYYVRIRTYKTIAKVNCFSTWSTAVKLKTK